SLPRGVELLFALSSFVFFRVGHSGSESVVKTLRASPIYDGNGAFSFTNSTTAARPNSICCSCRDEHYAPGQQTKPPGQLNQVWSDPGLTLLSLVTPSDRSAISKGSMSPKK